MDTIYVDHNATTPIAPEVYQAMVPYLTREFYNPSSMYERARGPAEAIARSRRVVADLLGGVSPDEIVFTACATESNNMALRGVAHANPDRRHIITSAVEHPAVLEVCKAMQRDGYQVDFLPVDERGMLDVADFVHALRQDTLIVSLMHGNNETGVLFPVEELARITKETDPGILFHTDATQTVGKVPIDLTGSFAHVDLLSFSGHKLHAPKGVGALYARRGAPVSTFLIGGHQERGRRAGTENVAAIVAMARACELCREHASEGSRVEAMRDRLESELVARIPYAQVNGRGAPRLPNTLNVSFHYIEGESILFQLDAAGICASSGSACTSGSLEPSHVLRAMHVPHTAAHGSVRFSFSRYNTETEVDAILERMPGIVAALRKISPYWDSARNVPREGPEIHLVSGAPTER
jgi:cysteine desulfurase